METLALRLTLTHSSKSLKRIKGYTTDCDNFRPITCFRHLQQNKKHYEACFLLEFLNYRYYGLIELHDEPSLAHTYIKNQP